MHILLSLYILTYFEFLIRQIGQGFRNLFLLIFPVYLLTLEIQH